jgi:hypothetical protein
VLTVPLSALDSVGLPADKVPNAAELDSEKLNVGFTLAVTAIWSALLLTVLIATVVESLR